MAGMQTISNIAATLFDMDGTLVDSETLTAPAIAALCREHGIDDPGLDCERFFGVAWRDIELALRERHAGLRQRTGLAERLHEIYHDMLTGDPPPLIGRSRETVIAANRQMPTAIVSSSGRASIEATMRRMEIAHVIDYYAGAEDCANAKPAPDGYLKAAAALGVDPAECLVFEDSIPGLESAKRAGMRVIAITHRCSDVAAARRIADATIVDFHEIDVRFFESIRKPR